MCPNLITHPVIIEFWTLGPKYFYFLKASSFVSRCLDNSLDFDQWKGYSAPNQM
jgi:hypothetical protein